MKDVAMQQNKNRRSIGLAVAHCAGHSARSRREIGPASSPSARGLQAESSRGDRANYTAQPQCVGVLKMKMLNVKMLKIC